MNQITLKDQTVEFLKALAYDCLANIEKYQNDLKNINAEIVSRSQPKIEVVEEKLDKPVDK